MNLFDTDDNPSIDPEKNYLEDLVGEGKKFADPAALARGKAEADAFIEQLKSEMAGLRQELQTRLKLEEAVEKITSGNRAPSSEQNPPANEPVDEPAINPETIKKLIADTLQEASSKTQRERNIATVEKALQDAFGPTFRKTVKEQAQKLGIGESFAQNLAAEQPQAFLKLFDVQVRPEAPSTAVTAPRPSVNSEAFGFKPGDTVKRQSHFEKLRKANPSEYWSPRVQNEMHREAMKQGESFFDV